MTERPAPFRPTRDLVVLSGVFFLVFAGAGSLQQYLIPYLEERAGWDPLWAPWSLATLYLSFTIWRLFAVHTIRRIGEHRISVNISFSRQKFPYGQAVGGSY